MTPFVYIGNSTFMETNIEITFNDRAMTTLMLDYTTRLGLLFADICDFIGLPVNLPQGLQTKEFIVRDHF